MPVDVALQCSNPAIVAASAARGVASATGQIQPFTRSAVHSRGRGEAAIELGDLNGETSPLLPVASAGFNDRFDGRLVPDELVSR